MSASFGLHVCERWFDPLPGFGRIGLQTFEPLSQAGMGEGGRGFCNTPGPPGRRCVPPGVHCPLVVVDCDPRLGGWGERFPVWFGVFCPSTKSRGCVRWLSGE